MRPDFYRKFLLSCAELRFYSLVDIQPDVKIHRLVSISLIVLLSISFVGICQNEGIPAKVSESELNKSIDNALDFLLVHQMDNGEFREYTCPDPKMTNCSYEPSPFSSALIIYSLKDIDDPRAKIMIQKGIPFLLSEQKAGGIWGFYTSKNSKEVYPDLDDTAMISYLLKAYNVSFDDNRNIIENNKNETGIFYTYIVPNEHGYEVDCVVNADVLLYLGRNDPNVCSYLNSAVRNNQSCALYYPDNISLFLAIARAYKNNVSCLNESRQIIIEKLKLLSRADGSFGNDLQTAQALNALMDLGYRGSEVQRGIANLTKAQSGDRSWKNTTFYLDPYLPHYPALYFGSKELTTALALEALNKYRALFIN